MPLYVKMDQKTWVQSDFTDSNTYDLSGTVYRDNRFATAETSLDTFTGTLRFINQHGGVVFSTPDNLTLNSNGTFLVKFSEGKTPITTGNVHIRLRLEKSGSRLTTIGVNGSDELFLEND